MIRINEHFLKLQSSYLFAEIARRVEEFQKAHPQTKIIKLGIGDVTLPLPRACVRAMCRATEEMGHAPTFHGYGPEQGYQFLREAIAENDYAPWGCSITPEEIFISDGAKCDTGNFQELFARDVVVAVPDPVYPVYVDSNVMAGRTGQAREDHYPGIVYLPSTPENNFVPELPGTAVELIYLCYPNNPTGATISKPELQKWVDYARDNQALILFDAAYEAFIQDDRLPRSIYEIPGAKEVAVEFRSFSKTAGFTGTRCAFTVVPKQCRGFTSKGEPVYIHSLWNRRQSTKFNGVSYPVQKAAAAVYTEEGRAEVRENIAYYLENAAIIRERMQKLGYPCTGGIHSPYIWIQGSGDSRELFDQFLSRAGVVCTPGTGFGRCGEGYIRLSAFNDRENIWEAMGRLVAAI